MNPNSNVPDGGRSSRAAAGVKASMSHLPGNKPQAPFYGEGMNTGNTTPTHGPTMHAPTPGATPPMQRNPMQRPGMGAAPITRKANP